MNYHKIIKSSRVLKTKLVYSILSFLVKGDVDGVGDNEGAVVTHEQNILVLHHLTQPLPLLYHGGWLVARVPGTPAQEPAGVLVDHLQSGLRQTSQRCGVWSVSVLQI